MNDLNIIYDYSEGFKVPRWLLVKPQHDKFDWSLETIYIPLNQTYSELTHEEINDDSLGLSVFDTELTVNTALPNHVGIFMPRLKRRINLLRGEPGVPFFKLTQIEHFVIQVSDLRHAMPLSCLPIFSAEWAGCDDF